LNIKQQDRLAILTTGGGSGVGAATVCPGWRRTELADSGLQALADQTGTELASIYAGATKHVPARRPAMPAEAAEQALHESERRYRDMEVSLVHANRVATLGQMTASIAHEINQPLAAIVTDAQAALRFLDCSAPNLEEARRALSRIARVGKRSADLVGRIRALLKKSPPRRNEFDLNEAILEVVALTHGETVRSGVPVETELADIPHVYGDRVQVQQVVLNLLVNAIEAMSRMPERSRQLGISTSESGAGEIVVTVQDSGPGIDPACIQRLFEPFHSTKPAGLGIGLSICRSIIEAHAGRIWVAASDLGGATFAFSLPAGHPEQAA
jgi:C4-dicarboxylate-specific signal transduction histidine kinase